MSFLHKQKKSFPPGISLFEAVVYVAFFLVITILITNLTAQLIAVTATTQATNDIITNARFATDTIVKEVRRAQSIYTPTSRFDLSPGQLALETTQDLPAGETSTFVDFYEDSGRLYIKREGQSALVITGTDVVVRDLTFTYLNQTAETQAVRVSITLTNKVNDSARSDQRSITLTTTAAVRQYAN